MPVALGAIPFLRVVDSTIAVLFLAIAVNDNRAMILVSDMIVAELVFSVLDSGSNSRYGFDCDGEGWWKRLYLTCTDIGTSLSSVLSQFLPDTASGSVVVIFLWAITPIESQNQ